MKKFISILLILGLLCSPIFAEEEFISEEETISEFVEEPIVEEEIPQEEELPPEEEEPIEEEPIKEEPIEEPEPEPVEEEPQVPQEEPAPIIEEEPPKQEEEPLVEEEEIISEEELIPEEVTIEEEGTEPFIVEIPEPYCYITSSIGEDETVYSGQEITFTLHLVNFTSNYTINWQYSEDGMNFNNIENEHGETYSFTITRANAHYAYRAIVEVEE